jgi:uncharacterized protein (DUF58 family)
MENTPSSHSVGSLLRPEVVARIENLELVARQVVEGFIAGLHRSPYHGFSVEFAEYRQYMPGDAVRNVDWKVFGKTDRYYVKLFEEETNLRATLLLDASGSMAFGPGGLTKLRYGTLLAASFAYLLVRQRDAAGLVTFDDKIRGYVPPRSVRRHLLYLFRLLSEIEPGSTTAISETLHEMAERIKRRGLMILISDLMDDPDRVLGGLKHFRHRNHEVLVFHLLDDVELKLGFDREAEFVDLETSETLRTQPWFLRRQYTENVQAWIRHLNRECREHTIDYNLITTSTPFEAALHGYLSRRARMG